jgi:hypothetical protein
MTESPAWIKTSAAALLYGYSNPECLMSWIRKHNAANPSRRIRRLRGRIHAADLAQAFEAKAREYAQKPHHQPPSRTTMNDRRPPDATMRG